MKVRDMFDRKMLVISLYGYYGLPEREDMSDLTKLIRADMKDKQKMYRLIEHLNYDPKEFFYHMGALCPDVFNKLTIKKIRENLEYGNT